MELSRGMKGSDTCRRGRKMEIDDIGGNTLTVYYVLYEDILMKSGTMKIYQLKHYKIILKIT